MCSSSSSRRRRSSSSSSSSSSCRSRSSKSSSSSSSSEICIATVNPEIFARILFSRIALKDIFKTPKIRD